MINNEQGFTFIELAAAIVIFVIGITGAMAMQYMAIHGNSYASRVSEATALAQSYSEEVLTCSYNDPKLSTAASYIAPKAESGEYTVTINSSEITVPQTAKEITVTVSWQKNGINHQVEHQLLKLQ